LAALEGGKVARLLLTELEGHEQCQVRFECTAQFESAFDAVANAHELT